MSDQAPRLTVRDSDDALYLVMAIQEFVGHTIDTNVSAARRSNDMAERLALSVSNIEATKYAVALIDAITVTMEDDSHGKDS